MCGQVFLTGSSIKTYCTPECRVKDAASKFSDASACWEWEGSRNPQTGYGQLSSWEDGKRKLYTAHRVSFSAHFGEIPKGLQVLHRCDNRPCFNPVHLFLGTQLENVEDMFAKGRNNHKAADVHWTKIYPEKVRRGDNHPSKLKNERLKRGSDHYSAKVTEDDVRSIRSSTETLSMLSDRFGLSQSSLSSIRRRKTWAHVT